MGNGGLTKLLWICTVLSKFGVVLVNVTAGTRSYFAYARDGALPCAKWLSTVNPVTKTPINATITLLSVCALLGLISLGSSEALYAFFSGSSVAGATAYMMPVLMRCLYEKNPECIPGPFSLGKWSTLIRWVAVIWTVFYVGLLMLVIPWYFLRAHK
ncbi:amino acid permease [Diaporthe helianthi]|uniref:Amino acid permease n=1 Tax=Diaporthe helianthi TaxID=158607 RepID=A0A2P5HXF5_DIAHE|nr:amino acid permease [Diaporthe helianthi]